MRLQRGIDLSAALSEAHSAITKLGQVDPDAVAKFIKQTPEYVQLQQELKPVSELQGRIAELEATISTLGLGGGADHLIRSDAARLQEDLYAERGRVTTLEAELRIAEFESKRDQNSNAELDRTKAKLAEVESDYTQLMADASALLYGVRGLKELFAGLDEERAAHLATIFQAAKSHHLDEVAQLIRSSKSAKNAILKLQNAERERWEKKEEKLLADKEALQQRVKELESQEDSLFV